MSQMAATPTIESLQPQSVWRFFAGMAAVPRPSKHEEKIRAHIRETARELGFAFREDETGNIVIEVPAAPGHESAAITVLQGHLDMVGEKNAGVDHDFENDPIRMLLDTDGDTGRPIVRADGTTLGADNGIGVAMALAAATDPEVVHGPLEILCTSDEEMGMTGAKALQPDFIKGRRLINLDSEEDDAIYIGCAGGSDITFTWQLDTPPVSAAETCRVTVSGLRGGHSGGDIHQNRGNAIKTLVRTLIAAELDDLQLVTMQGGSKRNAIPREAQAVVAGATGLREALRIAGERIQASVVRACGEADCTITVEHHDAVGARAASAPATKQLLDGLAACPSGVIAVVPAIPGLVQTSNNVSIITTDAADGGSRLTVRADCLTRSSSPDDMDGAIAHLQALGSLAGADVIVGSQYPGWQPNVDSPLLAVIRRIYEEMFGEPGNVTAVHAGLECGIIGERVGEIDMVSIGPTILGAHSPDERVFTDSVDKSYRFLKAILAELARG